MLSRTTVAIVRDGRTLVSVSTGSDVANREGRIRGPVFHHSGRVSASEREGVLGQRGLCLWFSGLSGSGKSTLAVALEEALVAQGRAVVRLDGDNVREGLCSDLGFGLEDRAENMRRVGEVARLFCDAGLFVLVALVSPIAAQRAAVRARVGAERFREVYVSTPLATCEARDVKGLYAQARSGALAAFTGISSPFEAPAHPDLALDTSAVSVEEGVSALLSLCAPFVLKPAV